MVVEALMVKNDVEKQKDVQSVVVTEIDLTEKAPSLKAAPQKKRSCGGLCFTLMAFLTLAVIIFSTVRVTQLVDEQNSKKKCSMSHSMVAAVPPPMDLGTITIYLCHDDCEVEFRGSLRRSSKSKEDVNKILERMAEKLQSCVELENEGEQRVSINPACLGRQIKLLPPKQPQKSDNNDN